MRFRRQPRLAVGRIRDLVAPRHVGWRPKLIKIPSPLTDIGAIVEKFCTFHANALRPFHSPDNRTVWSMSAVADHHGMVGVLTALTGRDQVKVANMAFTTFESGPWA